MPAQAGIIGLVCIPAFAGMTGWELYVSVVILGLVPRIHFSSSKPRHGSSA
jgi:hypothetical protein